MMYFFESRHRDEAAWKSSDQRKTLGRSLCKKVPRSSHADWSPGPDLPDPIERQNVDRLKWLVPVRHARMMIRNGQLEVATETGGYSVSINGSVNINGSAGSGVICVSAPQGPFRQMTPDPVPTHEPRGESARVKPCGFFRLSRN